MIATSNLVKRYLLTCGVSSNKIISSLYDELPDCILEALSLVENKGNIFIGMRNENMAKVSGYIRLSRKMGIIGEKVRFICN